MDPMGNIYVCNTLPQGVTIAPSYFNLMINNSLPDGIDAYFDDLMASVNNLAEFEETTEKLFKYCYRYNITLNIHKSQWYEEEVDMLGYKVGENTLAPSVNTVDNILSLDIPKTKKELMATLGVIGYARRFIPNLSKYLAPLSRLLVKRRIPILKKGAKPKGIDLTFGNVIYDKDDIIRVEERELKSGENVFDHNFQYNIKEDNIVSAAKLNVLPECKQALLAIKKIISNTPLLIPPNDEKQYIIYCDASDMAYGAVLCQIADDNRLRPIEYMSQNFSKELQKRKSTPEKELIAILGALLKFKPYISKRQDTVVFSDNSASIFALSGSNEASAVMEKMKFRITQFGIIMKHVSTEHNSIADYLSRLNDPIKSSPVPQQVILPNGTLGLDPKYNDNIPKHLELKDLNPILVDELMLKSLEVDPKNHILIDKHRIITCDTTIPLPLNNKLKKLQLIQQELINHPIDQDKKPFCPMCKLALIPTSMSKFYDRVGGRCKLCRTKLGPNTLVFACGNVEENHDECHTCVKCADKYCYKEHDSYTFDEKYAMKYKPQVNNMLIHQHNNNDNTSIKCNDNEYKNIIYQAPTEFDGDTFVPTTPTFDDKYTSKYNINRPTSLTSNHHLFVHSYRKVKDHIIKDEHFNFPVKCSGYTCNKKLFPIACHHVYRNDVDCDRCGTNIKSDNILYHCFNPIHVVGYDLCQTCAFSKAKRKIIPKPTTDTNIDILPPSVINLNPSNDPNNPPPLNTLENPTVVPTDNDNIPSLTNNLSTSDTTTSSTNKPPTPPPLPEEDVNDMSDDDTVVDFPPISSNHSKNPKVQKSNNLSNNLSNKLSIQPSLNLPSLSKSVVPRYPSKLPSPPPLNTPPSNPAVNVPKQQSKTNIKNPPFKQQKFHIRKNNYLPNNSSKSNNNDPISQPDSLNEPTTVEPNPPPLHPNPPPVDPNPPPLEPNPPLLEPIQKHNVNNSIINNNNLNDVPN